MWTILALLQPVIEAFLSKIMLKHDFPNNDRTPDFYFEVMFSVFWFDNEYYTLPESNLSTPRQKGTG